MGARALRYAAPRLGHMAVALALSTVLGACHSSEPASGPAARGADASASLTPAPPPQSPTGPPAGPASGAGVWFGGTLSRGGRVISNVMCFVTDGGQLACIFYAVNGWTDSVVRAARGTLTVGPSSVSGSGQLYAGPGTTLADGTSVVAAFAITGGALSDRNRLFEFSISSLGSHHVVGTFRRLLL